MNRRHVLLAGAALSACGSAAQAPAPPFPMRRGVNLGNALEAPNEGDWGYRIGDDHLIIIRDAGFDGVRLPVRWDAHAARTPPYTIDTAIMLRVAGFVDQALALGLTIQVDCHHYDALIANPEAERERFLAIWRQIAFDQQDAPPGLIFEPLNEPNGDLWSGARLAALQHDVLGVIRETNPRRLAVLGPGNWNSIDGLRDWTPPRDPHLAVSVHYYEPHAFTHEGAEWLGANAPRFTRAWGTPSDVTLAQHHIGVAARWAATMGYPLQLGEFGVNRAVSLQQRALWTRTVREACEASGVGWCAWDFAGAFPIWSRETRRWIPQMLDALVG